LLRSGGPAAESDIPHPEGSAGFQEPPPLILEGAAAGADSGTSGPCSWRLLRPKQGQLP
jgi:hypothetical protein